MSRKRSPKATRKASSQKPRRRPVVTPADQTPDPDTRPAVTTPAPAGPHPLAADLARVTSDAAAQEAALTSLPLGRQAATLLSWVGRGPRGSRQVTATGALRRSDLVEAAAIVGVVVRTASHERDDAHAQLPLERLPTRPDLPVGSVRGMRDVLPLARVWQALVTVGIVDVGPTTARLGQSAVDWLGGSVSQRLRSQAVFLVAYLVHTFEEDDRLPWVLSRGRVNAYALMCLLRTGPRTPAELDAAVPGFAVLGEQELERLATLGIVHRDDDRLGVAPGLEQLLAGALLLFLFDDDVDDLVVGARTSGT